MQKSHINTKNQYFWRTSSFLISFAALIGIITGFAAVIYQKLITLSQYFFYSRLNDSLTYITSPNCAFLIPAVGGLIVGIYVYTWGKNTSNQGVPDIIASVVENDGKLSPRLIIDKAIGSAITIGSGGSAGKAGPIITIGAAIGSSLGQLSKMNPDMLKTLLACGAAGGISATFNAPIGGVLFAQELILGNFATNNFIMIVISSVASSVISRVFLGNNPAFAVPAYGLTSFPELFFFVILGLAAGVISVLYIRLLYKFHDLFQALSFIPDYVKPFLAGIAVGLIGIVFPQIHGVGFDIIEEVLKNNLAWSLVTALIFVKMLATSITLGSGAPGGDFAPGLFIGAMLGSSWGYLIHFAFPHFSAPAGAYALVGMGGLLAGIYQAPVTAIIMLFEMTGEYQVILPLMLVCVLSSFVAKGIYSETIYTEKLARRGLNISSRTNQELIADLKVGDFMTTDIISLDAGLDLYEARDIILQHNFSALPVLSQGNLVGVISYEELLPYLRNNCENLILNDLMPGKLHIIYPADNLRKAMKIMSHEDIGRLMVVDPQNTINLLGIISRSDIIKAYTMGNI